MQVNCLGVFAAKTPKLPCNILYLIVLTIIYIKNYKNGMKW